MITASIKFNQACVPCSGSLGIDRELSQADLKQLLEYDPETGRFTWRERDYNSSSARPWANKIWNAKFAGKTAGSLVNGYVRIAVFGHNHLAHRLAWLYVYGESPDGLIDHISHVKDDNRIINLRVVDQEGNARNRNLHRDNKSGIPGVRFEADTSRWIALIRNKGRTHNLGRFMSFDAAVEARKAAEIQFGYHPNHGVNPT